MYMLNEFQYQIFSKVYYNAMLCIPINISFACRQYQ